VVAWQPANGTEQALAEALERGDRPGFFRILADAELFLPGFTDEPEDIQRFVVTERFGVTFLPVFTSLPALALVREVADGYRVTTCPELRAKWPRPDWRLAVNPGTPLDAYLPVDAFADAINDAIPTMAEAVEAELRDGLPEPEVADALRDAAQARDVARYVDTLLGATVLVPTAVEVTELVPDKDFPWRDGDIEVFTADAPVPRLALPFAAVLLAWPPGDRGLVVDPGKPWETRLSAEQVRLLLFWPSRDDEGG
jgi:hypothetical protein